MGVYDWRKPYRAAIRETDITKRRDRIGEARQAIERRLTEDRSPAVNVTEFQAIDHALSVLLSLELKMLLGKSGHVRKSEVAQSDSLSGSSGDPSQGFRLRVGRTGLPLLSHGISPGFISLEPGKSG